MHPDDYDVIFRLASDELRRVTNDYAFELRVFLAAKGKRAKLVLELLDSHGWAQSIDPQQPLAPMIGFIHLPPYDCTGMKDITVPSA